MNHSAPPAVDACPDEASKHPVGWWMLLHVVAGHQGYAFEETVEAFLCGVREACEDVAKFESADDALREPDRCIRSLESRRADIET